jgi:Holliday junction resolvase-like predicted endonuclease
VDNHIKGLWCETLVSIYLNSKNWKLVSHRKKIGSVEIDLVFKTPKGQMVLLEVKSVSSSKTIWGGGCFKSMGAAQLLNHRWGYSQKQNFQKVLESLICKYPYTEIYGVLALVDYNEINFYFFDEAQ